MEERIEEQIKKEAEVLAACMGEDGIEKEYRPLSKLSGAQRLFSAARHQHRAHGAFDKLAELFAQWSAKHPR